ncbi:hypothetical protein [uncultured Ilyobacter sp.]|nr:hypothetical protein [uncultured Ilyobacter sp.]
MDALLKDGVIRKVKVFLKLNLKDRRMKISLATETIKEIIARFTWHVKEL